jgi:hypothetical protein
MGTATITFHVSDAERHELSARAERDKVSLSDYIRVRLGLRGQGSEGDDDIVIETQAQSEDVRDQLVDHDQRLHALEDDYARRQSGA